MPLFMVHGWADHGRTGLLLKETPDLAIDVEASGYDSETQSHQEEHREGVQSQIDRPPETQPGHQTGGGRKSEAQEGREIRVTALIHDRHLAQRAHGVTRRHRSKALLAVQGQRAFSEQNVNAVDGPI